MERKKVNKEKLAEKLKKLKNSGKKETKTAKVESDKLDKETEKKIVRSFVGERLSDSSIENLVTTFRKAPVLKPVEEVQGRTPMFLSGLGNARRSSEDEKLYTVGGAKKEREYDTKKAVSEGIFYDTVARVEGGRIDMMEVGRQNILVPETRTARFVNPEENLRGTKKDLETNYVISEKVDMEKVGKDVFKKPREYWTK